MLTCDTYPGTEEDRIKQLQIVQLLMVEAGQRGNQGTTAMILACSNLNVEVVQLLYAKEGGIVDFNRRTALMKACKRRTNNEDT